MSFSLTELAEALEHESLFARLAEVRVLEVGGVLEIDLDLREGWDWEGDNAPLRGVVGLRGRGVLAWVINDRWIDGVTIVDDHPVLVGFERSKSRLSYRGEPADADAALAALHLAHARAVGNAVPLLLHPGSSFPRGWTTGTVAEGPTSLMAAYAEALERHGIQPVLLDTSDDATPEPSEPLRVCVLGSGYVVATKFETYGELPDFDDADLGYPPPRPAGYGG